MKKQGNMTPPIWHNNSLEIGENVKEILKKMSEKQFQRSTSKRRHTNMEKDKEWNNRRSDITEQVKKIKNYKKSQKS